MRINVKWSHFFFVFHPCLEKIKSNLWIIFIKKHSKIIEIQEKLVKIRKTSKIEENPVKFKKKLVKFKKNQQNWRKNQRTNTKIGKKIRKKWTQRRCQSLILSAITAVSKMFPFKNYARNNVLQNSINKSLI